MQNKDNDYQPDIQKLCEKFDLNRHNFVMLTAEICRLKGCSPKEMLYVLEEIDDLEQFVIRLKFAKEENLIE